MSDIDVNHIKNSIAIIKKFVSDHDKIGITNPSDLQILFTKAHPEIYKKYATVVKTICRKDDLTILNKMIKSLEQVNKGKKTMKEVSNNLGEELADKYLYPKVGKKNDDKST